MPVLSATCRGCQRAHKTSMDNKILKPQIKRYCEFELKQGLANRSVYEAGASVKVFDAGPAMFMLQSKMEAERKKQVGILDGDPMKADPRALAYSMGVVQTLDAVYRMFDQILLEAQEAGNRDE